MPGTRTTNTFSEEVIKLIQSVAALRAAPDADLEFTTKLLDLLTTKARMPEQALQQATGVSGGNNPMGNAALGLPGMPPLGPPAGPGPMPPMDMGMSAPAPSMLGAGAPPGVMPPPGSPQSGAELSQLLAGV